MSSPFDIYKTMNFVIVNNLGWNNQMLTPSGCKDIWIRSLSLWKELSSFIIFIHYKFGNPALPPNQTFSMKANLLNLEISNQAKNMSDLLTSSPIKI